MAAQILGARQVKRALPEFRQILTSEETNYFFLRAVLLAVAKMDDQSREGILQQGTKHSSDLVASLAVELLQQLSSHHRFEEWDHHTG
ncbi:MAG: hypothetical protein AB9891_15280 [Anaerolineaceae bacterium]